MDEDNSIEELIKKDKELIKKEANEIWDDKPPLIKTLETDPYFSDRIKTPAWDRFKNTLIKTHNLYKKNG